MSKRSSEPRSVDTKPRFSADAIEPAPIVAEATKDNEQQLIEALAKQQYEKTERARADFEQVIKDWCERWPEHRFVPIKTFRDNIVIDHFSIEPKRQ